jgi:hypothetical protein
MQWCLPRTLDHSLAAGTGAIIRTKETRLELPPCVVSDTVRTKYRITAVTRGDRICPAVSVPENHLCAGRGTEIACQPHNQSPPGLPRLPTPAGLPTPPRCQLHLAANSSWLSKEHTSTERSCLQRMSPPPRPQSSLAAASQHTRVRKECAAEIDYHSPQCTSKCVSVGSSNVPQ